MFIMQFLMQLDHSGFNQRSRTMKSFDLILYIHNISTHIYYIYGYVEGVYEIYMESIFGNFI